MATARSVIGLIGILIIGHVLAADGVPQRGTLYLHTNDHRDVLMATNNAGNVVAIADNGPWGDRGPRTRGMQQVRRTFDGWEHDDATGLLYAGARYYDPRLGRFLSVDPAGQAVYVALGSAPLELIDRDGRE